MKALGGDILMNEFLQPGFINRYFTRAQHIHLALIIIDTNDIVSDFREACARNEPYVS